MTMYLPQYCVLHVDVEQGDTFINGPFQTEDAAREFMGQLAVELKTNYDENCDEPCIVEEGNCYVDLLSAPLEDGGELTRQLTIECMITPGDKP